jgi:putative endonuclease
MQLTMPDGRPTTIATGAEHEALATDYLVRHGFRIVERNFKTKIGELDIIAREGDTLCFVEVRSRTGAGYGDAIEAVNAAKQARVTRMAQQYLWWRKPVFEYARFDVVGITAGNVRLIRDAWRLFDRL